MDLLSTRIAFLAFSSVGVPGVRCRLRTRLRPPWDSAQVASGAVTLFLGCLSSFLLLCNGTRQRPAGSSCFPTTGLATAREEAVACLVSARQVVDGKGRSTKRYVRAK